MKFAPTFVAWVVTSALMVYGASAQAPRRTTPKSSAGVNILLITIDTLRADHVGAYGAKGAETPTIDALARDGVLFERAYSQVPLTARVPLEIR